MRRRLLLTAVLLLPAALLSAVPSATAQIQGLRLCRALLAVDPESPNDSAAAFCRPSATVHDGSQQIPYDISVRAVVNATSVPDFYDLTISATRSGDFPRGLLYGHAELRGSQESCALDIFDSAMSNVCNGVFSSDGQFTLVVEAFNGALP